jgi:hypothetical protein
MPAHQLHAQADAEEGLTQGADDLVEATVPEVAHGGGGFAHAGKEHPAGCADDVGVVRHDGGGTQPFEGEEDGPDIAGVVAYDDGLVAHDRLR